MKKFLWVKLIVTSLASALVTVGGGHHDGDLSHHGHDHAHEHSDSGEDDLDHHESAPIGAWFQEGVGVMLTDETRQSLNLETIRVMERPLPNRIRLTMQVFGAKHLHTINSQDHTGCDVHGSAFLPDHAAAPVQVGQPVEVMATTNHSLRGVVLGVQKALALGESEIVIGVSNAIAALHPGDFLPARILLPRDGSVKAIPRSAILRTSEGVFVYALKGKAFLRMAVTTGAEADDWVEITEGLAVDDEVVTTPVQTLWLIELRATKGGGHSH